MHASPPRGLSRTIQILIVVASGAVLIALVIAPPLLGRTRAVPQASPAPISSGFFRPTDEQFASLRLATVKALTFTPVSVTEGKIAAAEDLTTAVFSPYSGRVTRVLVKVGDYVRRGAPVLAIQASEFVQGQNDLAAALATLETARAQARSAQRITAREAALYKINGAALKDVEQSRLDLATAQNAVRADEAALAAVRNRLRILGKSDAEIRALERDAGRRRRIGAEAIVAAPITGTVMQRQVGVGQNVQSVAGGASTALLSISDLSRVWMVANVREVDASRMHVGEPIAVRLLAYPGRVFGARLSYVAPAIDPATHRLAVRAEVENPGGTLKPEMFANFSIVAGAGRAAVGVPEDAVVYEGQTARVWVAGPNKTLGLRQIHTGQTVDGIVEVLVGLRPGEQVVTSGSVFIDRAAKGT